MPRLVKSREGRAPSRSSGDKYSSTTLGGLSFGLLQQSTLSDARLAVEQHHLSLSGQGSVEERSQLCQLLFPTNTGQLNLSPLTPPWPGPRRAWFDGTIAGFEGLWRASLSLGRVAQRFTPEQALMNCPDRWPRVDAQLFDQCPAAALV